MYIQLFINGELKQHWHFEDVPGPLADQIGTEARRKEWNRRVASCWREVEDRYPDEYDRVEMVIALRSRVRPKDISDAEYAQFTRDVSERQVGKVVGKHRPKMVDNEIK